MYMLVLRYITSSIDEFLKSVVCMALCCDVCGHDAIFLTIKEIWSVGFSPPACFAELEVEKILLTLSAFLPQSCAVKNPQNNPLVFLCILKCGVSLFFLEDDTKAFFGQTFLTYHTVSLQGGVEKRILFISDQKVQYPCRQF